MRILLQNKKETRVEEKISLWLDGKEKTESLQWPPGKQYILGVIVLLEMDPDPRRPVEWQGCFDFTEVRLLNVTPFSDLSLECLRLRSFKLLA